MKPWVDVLGTKYKIEIRSVENDKFLKEKGCDGYCSEFEKLIVIADLKTFPGSEYATETELINQQKHILRHELVHAFLNESGLTTCSNVWNGPWPKNEEMVDFFAVQIPKIIEAFKWCECI